MKKGQTVTHPRFGMGRVVWKMSWNTVHVYFASIDTVIEVPEKDLEPR
jgi:hypothetical protein